MNSRVKTTATYCRNIIDIIDYVINLTFHHIT